jgi:glycosyltransferase involved in cell wall biosynthesis
VLIHFAVDNNIHPARFGGAQRGFGLARGLARRHRVRVLCVVPNRTRAPGEQTVDRVELVRRRAWHTSVAWRLERLGLAPLFTAERGHRANVDRYRTALGDGADVLAVDLGLGALLGGAAGPLRVYASQNVEYDRFLSTAPRVVARARWAERLRRLERDVVGRSDLTVVCSDEDAERMHALHGADAANLAVIPNGYDETELRAPTADERTRARAALGLAADEYVALFVGADWTPNRQALAVLVERVMPALAGERIRLLVVGRVTRALGARRAPWLIAHGEAPELLPLLHAADAGLNPVLAGTGSNVKVPGYLAAGLAVITTPFGIRGYSPLAPHCVVAEVAEFADALRARPRGFAERGEAAPAALEDYAWGRLGEKLGEVFASRLGRRAPARGAA